MTIDVGQVMFGQTVTISSDVLRQFNARDQASPKKWVIFDGDANGFGIVPYNYRAKDFYNAVQWCVGLELFLLIDDPCRVFFTTDHPNGAPFTTYPEILALLMDRDLRAKWIAALPPAAMAVTTLASIRREYSLNEIATMTRAAPARLLGLADRGHLGPGAVADIAVYADDADRAKMFRAAALVFKDGDLVVRDGQVTHYRWGARLYRRSPDTIERSNGRMRSYYDDRYGLPADAMAGARKRDRAAGPLRVGAMRELIVSGVRIDDTFAEAFGMRATAVVITADSARWARQAAVTMTGFATSVIGCGCEAGIDTELSPRRDAGSAPGRARAAVRGLHRRTAEAAAEPGRAMRAHHRRHRLLRGACERRGTQPRQCAALLRRRLADLQALRRQALLAHAGHGRRICLRRRRPA